MKTFKKILVCLAILALLIPCVAVAASAEDGGAEPAPLTELEKILAIYQNDLYMVEEFSKAALGDYAGVTKGGTGVSASIVAEAGNNVLKIAGGDLPFLDDSYIEGTLAEDISGFVIEFDVKAGDSATAGTTVKLLVTGKDSHGTEMVNATFLSLDFNSVTTQVLAHVPGTTGTAEVFVCEDFNPTPAAWYTVSVIYDNETATYSFSIVNKADSTDAYVSESGLPSVFNSVSSAKLSVDGNTMTSKATYFDNVFFYGGNVRHNMSDLEVRTNNAIVELLAVIDNAEKTAEEKEAALASLDLIVMQRGFTSDVTAYKKNISAAKTKIANYFIAGFEEVVNTISAKNTYEQRVETLAAAKVYLDRIPDLAGVSGVDTDAYAALVAKYDKENSEVTRIGEDSRAFVELFEAADVTTTDYLQLKAWRLEADALKYDLTYPGVLDLYPYYEKLVDKIKSIETKGAAFIEMVNAMLAEEENFAKRYEYYLAAKEYYFVNTSYDGLGDAIVKLQSVEAEIVAIAKYCNDFIVLVDNADGAISIAVRTEYLANAKAYIDGIDGQTLNMTYAGMTEKVERYNKLVEELATYNTVAAEFIASVELIKDDLTHAEKKAAIAVAQEKMPASILDGIEGLNAALIKLSNADSDVKFIESYAQRFITLVNSAQNAETLKERYGFLKEARKYADAKEFIDGVTEAKTKLETLLSAYGQSVTAHNEGFASTVQTTAKMVYTAAPAAHMGKVFAIIVKFYE
ncbi:MAG: hypothetical protein IIX96_01940 [Clostridia bacterium]|nr:hypothetical protein [Clostridia bacterium]